MSIHDFQGNSIPDSEALLGSRISSIRTKKNESGETVAIAIFLEGGDVLSVSGEFPANAKFVGGDEALSALIEQTFNGLLHRVKVLDPKRPNLLEFKISIATDVKDMPLLWHVVANPDFDVDPSPRLVYHPAPKWTASPATPKAGR